MFTVEPVQRNLDVILDTAKTLGISEPSYMWTLLRGALSNETRNATIYVPIGREDNAALDEATSTANVGGTADAQDVKMFKGDEVIYDKGLRPELIKIDVQGVELLVMQGMKKLLAEDRNMVVVSEYDSKLMWANLITTMQPYDYMISLGFTPYCAPVLTLDAKGAIVANNSDDEITREKMMSTTDPVDTSKCGDITYIKNVN